MVLSVLFLVLGVTSRVTSMWIEEMENPGVYEGDMVMSPDEMEEIRKGTYQFGARIEKYHWPNAVVPYVLEGRLAYDSEFLSEFNVAIQQYEKYTCIRFKKRTYERGYMSFYEGGGCSSAVGYHGRRNRISLAKGCWWRAVIMHEIGHSLGLYHEQSRPDRDQHVTVLFNNIASGMDFNFQKQKQENINSQNTPYDFRSMMHYSWNAFGGNKMTIKTKDPSQQYEIGQRDGFSNIDVTQLNRMYKCKGNLPTLKPYVQPPPGCYDAGSGCAKHAFKGDCNKPSWRTYMHKKCRRACGLCGTKTGKPVTYPPYTRPPTKGTTKGNGSCSDKHVNCARFINYCKSNGWVHHMKTNCRRTCNYC